MVTNLCVECSLISMIDYSIHHCDINTLFRRCWLHRLSFIGLRAYIILLLLIINAHKCVTDFLSPTLNCTIFNNTAYSTLLPNIITANISGYTAIVAIHSVDIAAASHMLKTCTF